VKHDTWERREALGNAREALEEFKGRINGRSKETRKIRYVRGKRL